ncbi:TRAP transporter large permease subunit, partial [Pseudodesulfovibrio sp.]|nr:TRAP transporter large permease subunit [Pseudodesulfovibrio sp.]
PPMVIIAVICLIYVIGGMVMDALALLLVTIPIFFPVVTAMGYDPLWFGVLITVVTTLGAITPPVGVNTFIVASMAKDVPMTDVFKGVSYFMVAYVICIAILMTFPGLVTFVPNLMR